jgi:plastocyanin
MIASARLRGQTAMMLLFVAWGSGCAVVGQPREVTVIARGMTFVLADEPDTPNPVIQLRAGERVRLVLKNEAPGLLHNIRIPLWNVEVNQIRAGQTAEVAFTVPSALGRYEYLCRPHSELMKGFVEVVP